MWRGSPSILTLQIWYVATSTCPWGQTERQRRAKEDAGPAKREPSANIYWCQSRSACGELFLAGVGPVPTTHNTKASDLTDSPGVEISFNQNSMLTSLLRVILRCAHTQTQTKTLTHTDSPLNPCDVMGAGEEIQEVIKNRLFSQEKKKYWAMEQWEPVESIRVSCQLLTRCKPFIMSAIIVKMPLLLSVSLSYSPPPHKSRILQEFSTLMTKSGVFICESFPWSASWTGGWPQR